MWLAIRYAAAKTKPPIGTMLPSMAIRDKQLGFDGAVEYRELFQRHPDVERGPDEELEHHLNRLRAVDRIRTATRKPGGRGRGRSPGGAVSVNPTTLDDLADYDRLKRKYPDVPAPEFDTYGLPDEVSHLKALREREQQEQAPRPPEHVPPDLKGMPQRIPGWFTGDAMDAPPPGWGIPPMSRRDPGATMRSPVSPTARPQQQSMEDWIKWLGDKGIVVDDNGMRVDPAGPLPHRPLTGPQIWQPFVDSTTDESYAQYLRELPENQGGLGKSWRQRAKEMLGRRRASAITVDYIKGILVTAGVHDKMEENGWTVHMSGGGLSHYSKQIGDRIHVIVPDEDGWVHNSAPADSPVNEWGEYEQMGTTPIGHKTLTDAVMSAERGGKIQVGFGVKKNPMTVEDSSYHPERTEKTVPVGRLAPPGVKGRITTLNSTWSDM